MKLYHYDHCPFCVRVRMIIGWKGLQVEEEILANADEQRHYELIGAKMVPILEKDNGDRIKESLDIVAYIDQNCGQPLLCDSPEQYEHSELNNWLERAAPLIRHLVHPRNIRIFGQDFPAQVDRDYYEVRKSRSIGPFDAAFTNSAHYIGELEPLLEELKPLLKQSQLRLGRPGYAHILLFPALRSLTHVKGLAFPAELRSYLKALSRETKVKLLFEQAL